MILPVVLLFLSTVFAQNYEGDLCSMKNGASGVCTLLDKCPTVYQQLMAGHSADTQCGYSGFDPIVCCPIIEENRLGSEDGRGAKARASELPPSQIIISGDRVHCTEICLIHNAECAEYALSVYELQRPPILIPDRQLVNVSTCAIKSQTLIVGGTKAKPKEFPHMAAVGYDTNTAKPGWYCGGSLISEKFVLTAAHCTFSSVWGAATWVRVGDLNLERTDDGATPVDRRVTERIKHPEYKLPSQYHDIALLRLESKVPFNAWIRPACLHTEPSTGTKNAIATGWGHVEWGDDEGSSDLLRVTLPLVESGSCNKSYTSGAVNVAVPNGIYAERMICAGKFGSDTCQGDSGGPLVVFSKTRHCMYDIVGVTSLGRLCGNVIPGVYTRVYYYVSWIESVVWPDE